jgi:hypothetical protein
VERDARDVEDLADAFLGGFGELVGRDASLQGGEIHFCFFGELEL